MSKREISTERKIEAVEKYLRGETTLLLSSQELGIGLSTFHEWISKYQTFGIDGLRARGKQFLYTPETMHAAVNAELTRAVFGLTCDELHRLLEAYAKVFGTYNDYFQYPRLTRSPRATNYCDMTDVWIPEKFPYITFKESGQDFSHVSLWGFYRHIQLLTDCRLNSVTSKVLVESGVDEALLNRVFNLGRTCWHQGKVLKMCTR